ncbi:tail fiber protein [Cupriavidus sp. AcVe19-6a]|nr:tail fiber protein [Cupriavidus sp. AcVe19-1a]MBP0639086.1 tail fiber protein [Cupriavidus sp. AcVe19-6a]
MDEYLGEIRLCAFGFAPTGWALCNGALLPIAQKRAAREHAAIHGAAGLYRAHW